MGAATAVLDFLGLVRHESPPLPPIPTADPQAERVLTEIDAKILNFDNISQGARVKYNAYSDIQITATTLIPVTQIFPTSLLWKVLAGVLGAVAVIAHNKERSNKTQENYISWRRTCGAMQREVPY